MTELRTNVANRQLNCPEIQYNLAIQIRKHLPQLTRNFNALHHWHVSTGLGAGAGDVQIARIVGHRSTRTTKDVYGHLLEEGQGMIIQSVQDALEK